MKTETITTEKINKRCKCCNSYIRTFGKYSLTEDTLDFVCSNCNKKVYLIAKQKDEKYFTQIEVYRNAR